MGTLIHILHLEDDPVDAELILSMIEETAMSCRITLARKREEYEKALRQNALDIILADFKLPMYDGMSALRLAKELKPDVPFIFVSGTMGEEAAIEGLTQGATDYVLKHNLSRLPSAIKRALNEARNRRERLQAEAALRASEARYIDLYENAPDMYASINAQTGVIEKCNQTLADKLGCPKEEIIGRAVYDIYHPDCQEQVKAIFQEFLQRGMVQDKEFQLRKTDGSKLEVSLNASAVRAEDGTILSSRSTLRDITERKKLEEHLRQVQKMEAIGQLAGGIAHDFNNILSAITGYAELSQSILDPESTVFEYLTQVLEAGWRAKELINQILTFSRETDQQLRPIRVSFPVKEALKLIWASVPTSIEIRSKILSRASALADPTQIHQIVMNLCANAAHAMQEKGGRLDVSLTDITIDPADKRRNYPDAKPGDYIRLTVADQGYGIDAQYIHRIFDPFFTTKKMGEGTGMGLSVVHGIVKSYGGFIYVHSRLGEGSTFDILIPAKECAVSSDAILDKPVPTGSESILFVDDETMIVDIVKKTLESLGYRVDARTSAVEALEAFRNNPDGFDLVVTDMAMPKMSGLDLAEEILRIRPGLPIVLCTGFDVKMNEETIAEHGLQGIVYKPVLRRDLAVVVRKTLDSGGSELKTSTIKSEH